MKRPPSSRKIRMSISKDGQELLVHIPIEITRKIFVPEPLSEKGKLDVTWLTLREREVLKELFRGKVTKEIAGSMNLSVRTIKQYLSNIYRKFQVDGCRELLAMGNL